MKFHKTESSVPKYLLNQKLTLIFKVTRKWFLGRNVGNGFLDLENMNSEEISKIYKTQSSVPSSTSFTGS